MANEFLDIFYDIDQTSFHKTDINNSFSKNDYTQFENFKVILIKLKEIDKGLVDNFASYISNQRLTFEDLNDLPSYLFPNTPDVKKTKLNKAINDIQKQEKEKDKDKDKNGSKSQNTTTPTQGKK